MNSDEAIEAAVEELARGNSNRASILYENASDLLIEEGKDDAAAVHLMLAAKYAEGDERRADTLMVRAQAHYEANGNEHKLIDVLVARASRAEKSGDDARAERLFAECLLHGARRLAEILDHCLAVNAPISSDPDVAAMAECIAFCNSRIQEIGNGNAGQY